MNFVKIKIWTFEEFTNPDIQSTFFSLSFIAHLTFAN